MMQGIGGYDQLMPGIGNYDPYAQDPFGQNAPLAQWSVAEAQSIGRGRAYEDRAYWDETVAQYDATRGRYEQMLSGLSQNNNLEAIRSRYGNIISANPNRYAARTQEMVDRSNVAQTNRAAQMGMAGSSAAFGSAAEAQRGIETGMRDRQMGEALQGAQFEMGMDQVMYQRRLAEMAAQGGLMEMDSNEIRALQAMISGQDASNAQAQAGIMSGLGSIAGGLAGTFIGGPGVGTATGAMIGGGIGGGIGGQLKTAPTGYSSSSFGGIGEAPNPGFAGQGGFNYPGVSYSYNPYDFLRD